MQSRVKKSNEIPKNSRKSENPKVRLGVYDK